jgi:hypothetical protein
MVFSVLSEFSELPTGKGKGKSTTGGDKAVWRSDAEARGVGKAITRVHSRFFCSATIDSGNMQV